MPAGRKSNRLEPLCKRFFPNYSQLFEINNNSLDMTEMQPTLGKETLGFFSVPLEPLRWIFLSHSLAKQKPAPEEHVMTVNSQRSFLGILLF